MKKYVVILLMLLTMFTFVGCKSDKEKADSDVYPNTSEKSSDSDVQKEDAETADTNELQGKSPNSIYPIEIEDKFGNIVIVEKAPERVICFSPELVEIMGELGVLNTLIGRSTYCDYPQEVTQVTDMGDLFNLNMETIVSSEPDLILLSSMAGEDLVKSLTDQGLTVIVLDADISLDGVYSYISTLGKIFDVEGKSTALINSMKTQIEDISKKVESLEKPSLYYAVYVGEYTSAATGDTFIHNIIEAAGGINAAADGVNWMYTVEAVVEKDPDIIVCSMYWDAKNFIQTTEGYKDLTAVKNGKVFEIDENIFNRQGPRVVEAIETLARIMHPEAFE